jgi:CheY-like chemotaxis protein
MEMILWIIWYILKLSCLMFCFDLNMPGKTGIDCLKEIRSNARFKDVSIAYILHPHQKKILKILLLKGEYLH